MGPELTLKRCRFPGLPFVKNIEERAKMLQITPGERAALVLLANGLSTNELAGRFGVSECEMDAHLTTLFARMGAATRTEAIAAAFRRGLLIPDDQMVSGDASPRVGSPGGHTLTRCERSHRLPDMSTARQLTSD
jgi:DNA-binding CsgD family transcriptional regulator